MALHLVDATLADLWRFLAAKNWPPLEHEYRLMVAEALSGCVWACVGEKAPIAIGGVLISSPDLPGSAWLDVLPGLGSRVLPLALMMRKCIGRAAARHGPGVVCAVRDDNPEGQRLARLLGFVETDRRCGRLVEWRHDGGGRRDGHGQGRPQAGEAR